MSDKCTASTWFGPCGEAAEYRGSAACVHEHVRNGFLCNWHAFATEMGDCRTCGEGDSSHRCQLAAWEVLPLVGQTS